MEPTSLENGQIENGIEPQEVIKAALLPGLALYFANVVFSDNLRNYTNQMPEWLALLTSGIFLLFGISSGVGLFRHWRASAHQTLNNKQQQIRTNTPIELYEHTSKHEHNYGYQHNHSHKRISGAILSLVALPMVLGMAVPSKPLGAAAINTNNLATSSLSIQNVGQTMLDPREWNILEWKVSFEHLTHPQSWFNGRAADVIGFVVRPPDAPAGHFVAARFVMYHCAADAHGVGLLVKWSGSGKLSEDTWVRIKGVMRVEEYNKEQVLVLEANQVDAKIGVPQMPYLYPFIRENAKSGG